MFALTIGKSMHAVVCKLSFCLDINTQVYKHIFITLPIQYVEILTATILNSVVTAYMAFHVNLV